MRSAILLPIALLLVATAPRRASAQGERRDPIVLRFPGGTRAAAMAGASIATRDDEVIWYGPAQLVVARGASASWQRIGDADLRGVSAAFQSGALGIGIGAQYLAYAAPAGAPFATWQVGRTDAGAPASSLELAAGVARTVKGVRTGIVGRLVEEDPGEARAIRGTVDVGAGRTIGPVTAGIAVQHLGRDADAGAIAVRMPTQVTLGANGDLLSVGAFDLAGGASVSVQRGGRIVPRTGWELGWVWIEGHALQGRVGMHRPEWDGQSWLALGLGLTRDNLSLDYAFEPAADAPASHRVGVRVRP